MNTQRILERFEGSEFRRWAEVNGTGGLSAAERTIIEEFLPRKDDRILEMGCGGGRIVLSLRRCGYRRVSGIDFSARMVERALQNAAQLSMSDVSFKVGSALNIPEPNDSYDGLIYLAQVISCVVNRMDRVRSLTEAFRVLKPGGVLALSALSYCGRRYNRLLSACLRVARLAHNPHGYTRQMLPWLKKGSRPNWACLGASEAQTYWFYPEELVSEVCGAGFHVIFLATGSALAASGVGPPRSDPPLPRGGVLYLVARKPVK